MRIAIVCPMYINNNNHLDFTQRTTQSISMSHHFIWIAVHNHVAEQYRPLEAHYSFVQHPDETYILEGRQPQSVAKAWNDGIDKAIEVGADYIIVINNDILMRRDAVDKLVAFAEAHPDFVMWTMGTLPDPFNMENEPLDENWSEHPCFSAYMVRNDFFTHVGKFDENIFPAYFEDSDMHARLALANKKAVIYGGSRMFHFGSRTINVDEDFKEEMPKFFNENAAYFVRKWGTMNVGEVDDMRALYFKTPFNDPNKGLDSW